MLLPDARGDSMAPVVSVGIPTYNRSALLLQAIQSVLQQTYRDFEIIVSDDCSSDNTAEVVAEIRDARIMYHRTATNLRPPRNWNECVRLARGEFFALLPDDDVYCPEFLAELVRTLQAQPDVGFAQCGFYSVDTQLRCLRPVLAHDTSFVLNREQALIWHIEHLTCIPATLLFRRSAMLEMGLWREDYWDDWAFILRLAYRRGFVFVPKLLACNRVHAQNLNLRLQDEGRDAILDLINQQADVFGEALPATPALVALRARLDRQLSQHCVLLAFGALRRRDWASAQFHWTRAQQLNVLAGLDLGWVGLWRELRAQVRQAMEQRQAAQTRAPVIRFEAGR